MRIIDADKYRKDLLSTYDDCSMELEVLDRQPLISAIPIDDNQNNKIDNALMLINDAHLTRSEAYDLFSNLKTRIFADQPSRIDCRLKHIDFEKAINDYWNGIYEVPNGWIEKN